MNTTKTKIIAFEGIDGSGKTVQFRMLYDYLISQGKSVLLKEYPVYTGFFGKTVGELLSGRGSLTANDVDPKSMALWFALDRFDDLKSRDYEGYDYMLINRYVLSNMVYQSMRAPEIQGFTEWVHELEHEKLGIPVPDAYVLFDTDEHAASENVRAKGYRDYVGEGQDVYEQNADMQTVWRKKYLECAARYGNIINIGCTEGGRMLPVDSIAGCVREELKAANLL